MLANIKVILIWKYLSVSQSVSFLQFHSNLLKAFQINLKAFLGLTLHQYCHIHLRKCFSWTMPIIVVPTIQYYCIVAMIFTKVSQNAFIALKLNSTIIACLAKFNSIITTWFLDTYYVNLGVQCGMLTLPQWQDNANRWRDIHNGKQCTYISWVCISCW